MGLFEQWPYTNLHTLNLDWILESLKELEHTIEQFVSINALKYADPIQWNITNQYEKNTIVIDPLTGTAYISVQPVPSGVALTRDEYWTVVFDLGGFVVRAAKNFTSRHEDATTLTATFSTPEGSWVVWGDVLYKALVNITAGDSYVVGGNIEHITMEDILGHIEDLTTTVKSNIVAAINELNEHIGDIGDLTTQDKSSLVNAANEILDTLSTAISGVDGKIGNLTDLNTQDQTDIVSAINELVANIYTINTNISDLQQKINALHKDTVADMIVGDYVAGDYVETAGYHVINDGGAALYKIIADTNLTTSSDTGSDGIIHFAPELSAKLIITDYVNVKQFGAKGDRITDDTSAIQNATDYAADTYGTVFLPAGTYHITSSINITKLVFIKGDTEGSTKFIDQFDTGVFNITSSNGAWFFNLLFIFNVNTTVNNCAFYMNNAFGLNLKDIEQIGQSYNNATEGMFLHAVGTSRNIIIDNIFVDCGGSTYALNFDLTYNNAATDIIIRNSFIDNYLGKLLYFNNVSDVLIRGSILRCKNTILTAVNTQAPWCFITNSCNTLDSVTTDSVIYDISDKCSILDDSTFADRNNQMLMSGASYYYRQHDTGYVITEPTNLFTPVNAAGYGLRRRTFNPFWAFNTAADDTIKGAFFNINHTYNEINLDVMGASNGLRYGIALLDSTTPNHYLTLLYAPRTGMVAVIEYTNGVENIIRQWMYWDVPAHQFSAVRNTSTGIWNLLIGNGRGVYQTLTSQSFDANAKVGFIEITNNTQGLQTIVDLIDGRFLY